MSIALVQTAIGSSTNGDQTGSSSPVAASWGSATTAGSLLLAILGSDGDMGTVTPPSGGWTLYTNSSIQNGTQAECKIYYILNASSQSGSSSWSYTGEASSNGVSLILAEYSGIATSSATDGNAVTNTQTATGSGVTGNFTTSNANDLLIAVFAETVRSGTNFSSPTNSFVIEKQQAVVTGNLVPVRNLHHGFSDRIVSSTGTYSTGVTGPSTSVDTWASVIVAFKAATGATEPYPAGYANNLPGCQNLNALTRM